MTDVLAIILGGGQGKRLYPLTYRRSKPAVPIGGKYRLIDIPISNCLHAGIRRIFVLTQFNSASLNRHVGQTYRLDHFSQAFVDIIAAEQTPETTNWFQGTADAVRRAMPHFINLHADHYLILAGDHLYRMDFDEMVQAHVASGADITIAAQPTNADDARGMGIFRFDRKGQIEGFEEKPSAARLEEMGGSLPAGATTDFTTPADKPFVASMGIYVFTRKALVEALAEANVVDFGHEIIPKALGRRKVRAYAFNGYWADVGTLRSFFDANISLTQPGAEFSFYHPTRPVFSRPRFLPPSWVDGGSLCRTVVSDGASVCHAEVEDSIVGLRMQVSSGAKVKRAVLLGADEYDDRQAARRVAAARHRPRRRARERHRRQERAHRRRRDPGQQRRHRRGRRPGLRDPRRHHRGAEGRRRAGRYQGRTGAGGDRRGRRICLRTASRLGERAQDLRRQPRVQPAGSGRRRQDGDVDAGDAALLELGRRLEPHEQRRQLAESRLVADQRQAGDAPFGLQRAQHVARLDARLQGLQLHDLRLLRERRRQQVGGLPGPRERAGQDQVRPRVDRDEAAGLAPPPLGALRGQRPLRVVRPGRAALLGDGVAH